MPTPTGNEEARRLSRYLLGREADGDALARYDAAVAVLDPDPAPGDRSLLELVRRRPRLWPLVDAGCALTRPAASPRRRSLAMLAVLESEPELADSFLPVERPRFYALRVGGRALLAGLQALAGAVLVWAVGR